MNRNERLMLMALVGSGLAAGTVYAVYRAKKKPPPPLPPSAATPAWTKITGFLHRTLSS